MGQWPPAGASPLNFDSSPDPQWVSNLRVIGDSDGGAVAASHGSTSQFSSHSFGFFVWFFNFFKFFIDDIFG